MSDIPLSAGVEPPPPTPAPNAVVQSAAIGFKVIYVVTLLLAVLWLGSNFRVITSDRQAVVMQFGRVVRVQKTGLLLAWPRPIEQVRMLPGPARQLSRQVAALPPLEGITPAASDANGDTVPATATPYLTGDGRVVLLDAHLNYRITDPVAYVLSEPHVAPGLDRMFRAAAVKVTAGQGLNDFLVAESADGASAAQTVEAARARVRERLLAEVNRRLADLDRKGQGFGIRIDRIDLTAWLPPEAKLAFDSVLTAGQKADQAIAAANTAAELRRQGAQREADRLVSAAQAVAAERKVAATVDTASILAIEKTAGGARNGLADQTYRARIGGVLAKAGSVVVVDPANGKRIIMTAPGKAAGR